MVDILIALACVLSYLAIGAWTFGYSAASWAADHNLKNENAGREGSYYHDEPGPWFAAANWPVYLLIHFILGKMLFALVRAGDARVVKNFEARRVRIELEKRIRVEQERIEREVTEEVEEALQQRTA